MCEMNRAATAARREMGKSTDGEIILQLFLEVVRPVVVRVRPMISKLVNQITDANAKSFGDSDKSINTGYFLAPFQFTDVNRMQVSLFRQFFLTHFGAPSEPANGFADDFRMSQRFGHAFSGKHEAGAKNTVHSPLFCSCHVSACGVKSGDIL